MSAISEPAIEAEPRSTRPYFRGVNQLRALAVLLVVWAHLVGGWLTRSGTSWKPHTFVRDFIGDPLVVSLQFGFLGVAIFFLISGFVITHAALGESVRTFAIRRALRIYVPLFGATVITLAVAWAATFFVPELVVEQKWVGLPSLVDALTGFTLAGYFTIPQVVFVTVAWTLAVEVLFYILIAASIPLLRIRALPQWLVPAILVGVVAATMLTRHQFGDTFFLFSAVLSCVPMLLIGQAIYLTHQGRIRPWQGAVLVFVNWGVLVWGLKGQTPLFFLGAGSQGPSVAYAVAIFVIVVLLENRARPRRVADAIAARSYSLYLVHAPVGLFVLAAMTFAGVTYRWALLAALVVVAMVTEGMYRGLERPSIAVARRLTRRPSRGKAVTDDAFAPNDAPLEATEVALGEPGQTSRESL